jgi:subtilase family serine protease
MMKHALPMMRILLVAVLAGAVAQQANADTVIANHHPNLLARSAHLGALDAAAPVQVTLALKLHNPAVLEATLAAQAAGGRQYLSNRQVDQQHAPAASEVATVTAWLRAQGLDVTGVAANNLFVTASGSAAAVQAAFGVELHQYRYRGQTFHANTTAPKLPDHIAPLVASVNGLTSLGAHPNVKRAVSANGETPAPVPLASVSPDGLLFSSQCFRPAERVAFSGNGASATYRGTRYGQDAGNTNVGSLPPCGYQPSDLQAAFKLNSLYSAGYDGSGQTIAIVDAFGSTTIASDLATFSQAMGLPPADLTIVGTPTESAYSGDANAGWAEETTLDVEWVHAIAPRAKILLVVAADNYDANLLPAVAYAAAQPGVVAVSNSWSSWESYTDAPTRAAYDAVFRLASARGVSVHFSSGDSGNEAVALGYADVDYPGSSPYATSIGGVSLGLDASSQVSFLSSWGTNLTRIADTPAKGNAPIDPPLNLDFQFGGGGGESNIYAAPSFQRSLGYPRRVVPDISWVADPYTGVEIIETLNAAGDQGVSVIGGTSVACPMFSGLWGLVAQRTGHPLGQAAPLLYRLPAQAIVDVNGVPASFAANNVRGTLTDASGTQTLTTTELALPLQGLASFASSLYNSPYSGRWFALTFGTDSTLPTGPGWDAATGLGIPNGASFVLAFPRDN